MPQAQLLPLEPLLLRVRLWPQELLEPLLLRVRLWPQAQLLLRVRLWLRGLAPQFLLHRRK